MGLLTIAILVVLAALTSQKSHNSHTIDKVFNNPQIERAFQELIAQSSQGYSSDDTVIRHSKNHKNPNPAQYSLNKPRSSTNQKALRDIEEAICQTTGRCGCNGNRCNDGDKDRDNDSKELSRIINRLQRDLENYGSSSGDLRCGCVNNQPHRGYKPYTRGLYNLRCGCQRKRPYKRTSRNSKDENYDKYGKETVDDNLNIVVFELNGLRDRKSDHEDYTRTREDNSQKRINDEVHATNNDEEGVSPDDFINQYHKFKATKINKLKDYILYQKNGIDLSRLSESQRNAIQDLQNSQSGAADTVELEQKIVSLIFGSGSAVKVFPHDEQNEHIYIPRHVYDKIRANTANAPHQTEKENIPQNTRARGVLPLTKKQKSRLEKLIQKQQNKNAMRPHVWRRSISEDVQNYGAPFELDIQGLGQVNPK